MNKTNLASASGARGNSRLSFIDLLLVLVVCVSMVCICVHFHMCAGVYGGKTSTLGVFFSVATFFFFFF